MVRLPAFGLFVAGSALSLWGFWALYTAVANYDPQSETPRWFSWAAAVVLLALGAVLLAAARTLHRLPQKKR